MSKERIEPGRARAKHIDSVIVSDIGMALEGFLAPAVTAWLRQALEDAELFAFLRLNYDDGGDPAIIQVDLPFADDSSEDVPEIELSLRGLVENHLDIMDEDSVPGLKALAAEFRALADKIDAALADEG